jgi:hypothetical protein
MKLASIGIHTGREDGRRCRTSTAARPSFRLCLARSARFKKFTLKLIDCQDFSEYDMGKLTDKGLSEIQLMGTAAKRVVLRNLKEMDRILHSHIFSVSIMHMIEEFVYDFSQNEGAK